MSPISKKNVTYIGHRGSEDIDNNDDEDDDNDDG